VILAVAACLLIHNVTAVDPGTGSVQRADVRIEGDRITRIGGMWRRIECERTIDGTGKFLIPGLTDMHAHLFNHPWDEKGNIRPRYDRPATEQMLRTLLAFGVTTIRDPGSETEAAVTLREMVNSGKVRGPTIVTCGRILNQSDFDPEPFTPVQNADEMRREIRWQAAAGVDCIKIYASTRPELAKVAIDEAHKHKLPILGHLQRTTWTEAARFGIDGVEHAAPWSPEYVREADRAKYEQDMFGRVFWLEHLDDKAIDEMVATLAKHRVVVDPTLMAMATKFEPEMWSKKPDVALAPEIVRRGWPHGAFTKSWTPAQFAAARRAWPKLLALTKKLHDGGVTIVVGTDTATPWIVPGASVHEEMLLLRDAGLTPMEVLRAATANAALALRRPDIGAIRLGARADLVLLDRNPLEDLRNTRSISLVIHNGVAYDPAALLKQ
jgi:imidazolonepropionase-like amidohydrolase